MFIQNQAGPEVYDLVVASVVAGTAVAAGLVAGILDSITNLALPKSAVDDSLALPAPPVMEEVVAIGFFCLPPAFAVAAAVTAVVVGTSLLISIGVCVNPYLINCA